MTPTDTSAPCCGTCAFWRQTPPNQVKGQCVWLMHRPHPYWLSEVKLTHEDWGTACLAYERKL